MFIILQQKERKVKEIFLPIVSISYLVNIFTSTASLTLTYNQEMAGFRQNGMLLSEIVFRILYISIFSWDIYELSSKNIDYIALSQFAKLF